MMLDSSRRPDVGDLVDQGGLGYAWAGRPQPFYLQFARITNDDDPPDLRFTEITFNPSMVDIDGHPTDVLVSWGTKDEVVAWLAPLLSELAVETCTSGVQGLFQRALFGLPRAAFNMAEGLGPWDIRRLDGRAL